MAVKKIYDLAVKVGEYTNSAGEKKARWQNIGSEFQSDDGSTFQLIDKWFNPAGVPDLSGKGGASVLVSKFAPKQQGGQTDHGAAKSNGYQPQAAAPAAADDDIPF